ncbi:outer membrane protein assembly factor BamE [Paucimonas lemoignei]|uniref:Outer membrane protein assembly factor BamE n=1 Tax=Paucimonas lemoignei TaxID=29443 RepID=A0A4R3HW64_PAULE|nr:outer membrane protein assembly factor BamE [Paucimonas lemoignei]
MQTTRAKRLFGIFSPYRIDIQQGNFISQEQLDQLKLGMTPDQVRFVLGTPLLTDIFHANRWDYVFRLQKGNGEVISSRIAVHFEDNRLAKIDAGTLPSERDYLSLIAGKEGDKPKVETPKAETPKANSDNK